MNQKEIKIAIKVLKQIDKKARIKLGQEDESMKINYLAAKINHVNNVLDILENSIVMGMFENVKEN